MFKEFTENTDMNKKMPLADQEFLFQNYREAIPNEESIPGFGPNIFKSEDQNNQSNLKRQQDGQKTNRKRPFIPNQPPKMPLPPPNFNIPYQIPPPPQGINFNKPIQHSNFQNNAFQNTNFMQLPPPPVNFNQKNLQDFNSDFKSLNTTFNPNNPQSFNFQPPIPGFQN